MTTRPAAEPDLLSLERQVCFALSVANRSVLAVYRPILEPLGLTRADIDFTCLGSCDYITGQAFSVSGGEVMS